MCVYVGEGKCEGSVWEVGQCVEYEGSVWECESCVWEVGQCVGV